jgi:uncharacterized surface protein with fasciclin (FAS1) repeats
MKQLTQLVVAGLLLWGAGCQEGSAPQAGGPGEPSPTATTVKEPTPEEINKELQGKTPVAGVGDASKVTDVVPRGDGRQMIAGLRAEGAKTYLDLMEQSGVAKEVAESPALTFLVPTEEAFAKMPAEELRKLKGDKAALADFVKNHILAGYMRLADLRSTTSVASWNQRVHPIQLSGDKVTINGADLLKSEVKVGGGLMYQIDRVLPLGQKLTKE